MSDELKDILEQYRAMKEINAELLGALRALETAAGFCFVPSLGERYELHSAIDLARSAIARATGEPPCAA